MLRWGRVWLLVALLVLINPQTFAENFSIENAAGEGVFGGDEVCQYEEFEIKISFGGSTEAELYIEENSEVVVDEVVTSLSYSYTPQVTPGGSIYISLTFDDGTDIGTTVYTKDCGLKPVANPAAVVGIDESAGTITIDPVMLGVATVEVEWRILDNFVRWQKVIVNEGSPLVINYEANLIYQFKIGYVDEAGATQVLNFEVDTSTEFEEVKAREVTSFDNSNPTQVINQKLILIGVVFLGAALICLILQQLTLWILRRRRKKLALKRKNSSDQKRRR